MAVSKVFDSFYKDEELRINSSLMKDLEINDDAFKRKQLSDDAKQSWYSLCEAIFNKWSMAHLVNETEYDIRNTPTDQSLHKQLTSRKMEFFRVDLALKKCIAELTKLRYLDVNQAQPR